ncbi:hypothetical protein OIV83_006367 [Microbotryomycetes sp. JL201]|nr:hypothetical protein OIV83_006367 [Microbotryomycetes sp. JL201]
MDEVVDRLLKCALDNLPAVIRSPVVHASLVRALTDSTLDAPAVERAKLAQLVTRLAARADTLTVPLLAVFCGAFQRTNSTLVHDTVALAFDNDPQLQIDVCEHGPTLLIQACDAAASSLPTHSSMWTRQALTSLLALARSHPLVASSFGQVTHTYTAIAHLYKSSATEKDLATLQLKLDLLATTFALLDKAFLTPILDKTKPVTTTDRCDFWSELIVCLDTLLQNIKTNSIPSHSTPLINATLVRDLQRYYKLATKLDLAADGLDRGTELARSAHALCERVRTIDNGAFDTDDGLEVIRRLKLGGQAVSNDKGKAKSSSEVDPVALDAAVSQILDVLPDQQPEFLRTCLQHPHFIDAPVPAEAIIAALLEDSLPPGLRMVQQGEKAGIPPIAPVSAVPERRNVFDDAKIDSNMLRRGKTSAPDDVLDKSFMSEALKAAIIARAERDSSDDEDSERDLGDAFVEDQDDYGAPTIKLGVNDGHNTDGGQGMGSTGPTPAHTRPSTPAASGPPRSKQAPADNPFTPIITSYLEQMYLDNPALFAKDSATRKSKPREQMRKASGLGDDRIEEFARMIERNPNKDKLLGKMQNKHEFKGNKVDSTKAATDRAEAAESELAIASSEADKASNGARGDGQRGLGRGGRGRHNGGKMAHERRVRGNDRKMQKMGVAPQ